MPTPEPMRARAILTDIEGTVGSVSFVKDVLFPYARARLAAFVTEHAEAPEVAALLAEARTLGGLPSDAPPAAVATLLIDWLDADRKAPPLKALQGMIWRGGYASGALKAHVYDDAVAALAGWAQSGLPVYVYSSGSVEAQDLFFGHTVAGDLRSRFRGFFDTRTGAKTEPDSYRHIAEAIGLAPAEILFLSDLEPELAAARTAGLAVAGVHRPGNAPLEALGIPVVTSFAELALEGA